MNGRSAMDADLQGLSIRKTRPRSIEMLTTTDRSSVRLSAGHTEREQFNTRDKLEVTTQSNSKRESNPGSRKRTQQFIEHESIIDDEGGNVAFEPKRGDPFTSPISESKNLTLKVPPLPPVTSSQPNIRIGTYITDIVVVSWGEKPPPNYLPIKYLGDGNAFSLGRGAQIYAEWAPSKPPVTGIAVYFPNKSELPPPGYTVPKISTSKGPGNLNSGAPPNMRAYLTLIRGDGHPIIDVGLCSSAHVPANWTGIDRSPLGYRISLGASRAPRSVGTGTAGVTILCVKHDMREMGKFKENNTIRYGDWGEDTQLLTPSIRRKGSLLGQMFGSVTPTVNPLRKSVLVRRSTAATASSTTSISPTAKKSGAFFPSATPPPSRTSDQVEFRELVIEGTAQCNPVSHTRLQMIREKVLSKLGVEEGLGVSSLAFDPEVAGLLVSTELLERIVSALSNIARGSVLDALLALRELHSLVRMQEILPSVPVSEQMTMYDFFVLYGASVAVERGADILMAPACRIVVEGLKEARTGVHPVTLHHALSVVCRSYDMFTKVKDEFFNSKAHAMTQESLYHESQFKKSTAPSSMPTTLAITDTSGVSKIDRNSSAERLESLVSRLSGFSFSSPAPPQAIGAHNPGTTSVTDPQFYFIFPAESPEQLLGDRAYVQMQATHSFFQDMIERCHVYISASNEESEATPSLEALNTVLERVSSLVSLGKFAMQTSLEVYLLLLKIFSNASPLVDLLFSLAWLCSYTNTSFEDRSTLLQDFLLRASANGVDSEPIGFAVRRLVFPLIMRRASYYIKTEDNAGIDDTLNLLTVIWRSYRKHMKAELCVAFNSLIIPCLRTRNPFRLRMLELVSNWLSFDHSSLVEIFLNFENDSPIPHWTVFQDLIDALCLMIRPPQKRHALPDTTFDAQGNSFIGPSTSSVTGSAVKKKASSSSTQLNSSFFRSAGQSFLHDDEEDDGDEDMENEYANQLAADAATILVTCLRHLVNLSGHLKTTSKDLHGWEDGESLVDVRRNEERKTREVLQRALQMAKTNGSAKAAVNFLIASGNLEETPNSVAQFLRLHLNELGETNVGEYLGEGGKNATEQAFMVSVRDAYIKAAPRDVNDTLDEALRRFLTTGGFHLPGEGQKIERLIEAFSRRFILDRPDLEFTETGILLLSFSLVMLNTDLHKPQIKQKAKMKKEDFFRNVSGIDDGKDFPKEFLSGLYDSIAKNEIRFIKPQNSNPDITENQEEVTLNLLSKFNDCPEDELDETAILHRLTSGIEQGTSILATVFDRAFTYHSSLTRDAARVIFETISTKVFQIVSSVLEDEASRFEIVSSALEMLEYAIQVTLFLNLTGSDRRAFASLLAKLVVLHRVDQPPNSDQQPFQSVDEQILNGLHLNLDWFEHLMLFEKDEDLELISKVHILATKVAERIAGKEQEQQLQNLSQRLAYPELLSTNAERVFLREGPMKIRNREKIFFLFSDCLLRAESTSAGKLRVEESLPLRTLRVLTPVNDQSSMGFDPHVAPEGIDCRFEIRSPLTSYIVQAATKRDKESWIRDITLAISNCTDAYNRLELAQSPLQTNRRRSRSHDRSSTPSKPIAFPLLAENEVEDNVAVTSSIQQSNKGNNQPLATSAGDALSTPSKTTNTDLPSFNQALELAKALLKEAAVDTATKLLVYGYFKQASKGDCSESMPKDSDIKKAKWHAWRAHFGATKEEARAAFIRVVVDALPE